MSSFSDKERAREWLLDIVDYAGRLARHVAGRSFEVFAPRQRMAYLAAAVAASFTEPALAASPGDGWRQLPGCDG